MSTRIAKPCNCEYQKIEKPWGYQVFSWNKGQLKWHRRSIRATPDDAIKAARRIKRVLLVCRGCGSELIREI